MEKVLITGASRGVGRSLLEAYLSQTIAVAGTYLTTAPDDSLAAFLSKVDITDAQSVDGWIKREGNADRLTLINCSGISYNAFTHKADNEQWKRVVEVNLIGAYHAIRSVLPLMRERKFGRIINFSSVVAKRPTPGISAYAASKSALWGLSKSIAAENGALGITCNCINLGYAQVGMGVEKVPEKYQEVIKAQIPSGEFCPPGDIFGMVEMLRACAYVNGADLDLNGGLA